MKKRGKQNLLKIMSMSLVTTLTLGIISNYDLITSQAHNLTLTNSNNLIVCSNDNIPNLKNNYNNNNMLCRKLEYDKSINDTTLSTNIEKQLNEVGVFDSEIKDFDNSEIADLNNAQNISVSISYYSINNDTTQKIPMNNDEISSIVNDCIENGSIAYENPYNSNLLAKLNLIPNVAYATPKKATEDSISKSGAVKQTIVCSQKKKGGEISVTYTVTWLKEAQYRETDIMGLTFPGAVLKTKTLKCTHTAKFRRKSNVSGIDLSKEMKTNPSVYLTTDNSFVYKINLFGNRTDMNSYKRVGRIESYSNEKIKMSFKCYVNDKSLKTIPFTNYYFHTKTEYKLNPSISLGTDSIGVSVSPSKNKYLEPLKDAQFTLGYKYI